MPRKKKTGLLAAVMALVLGGCSILGDSRATRDIEAWVSEHSGDWPGVTFSSKAGLFGPDGGVVSVEVDDRAAAERFRDEIGQEFDRIGRDKGRFMVKLTWPIDGGTTVLADYSYHDEPTEVWDWAEAPLPTNATERHVGWSVTDQKFTDYRPVVEYVTDDLSATLAAVDAPPGSVTTVWESERRWAGEFSEDQLAERAADLGTLDGVGVRRTRIEVDNPADIPGIARGLTSEWTVSDGSRTQITTGREDLDYGLLADLLDRADSVQMGGDVTSVTVVGLPECHDLLESVPGISGTFTLVCRGDGTDLDLNNEVSITGDFDGVAGDLDIAWQLAVDGTSQPLVTPDELRLWLNDLPEDTRLEILRTARELSWPTDRKVTLAGDDQLVTFTSSQHGPATDVDHGDGKGREAKDALVRLWDETAS